jgi:hypothetical protein
LQLSDPSSKNPSAFLNKDLKNLYNRGAQGLNDAAEAMMVVVVVVVMVAAAAAAADES